MTEGQPDTSALGKERIWLYDFAQVQASSESKLFSAIGDSVVAQLDKKFLRSWPQELSGSTLHFTFASELYRWQPFSFCLDLLLSNVAQFSEIVSPSDADTAEFFILFLKRIQIEDTRNTKQGASFAERRQLGRLRIERHESSSAGLLFTQLSC